MLDNGGAPQQFHAVDIQGLTLNILLAHEHLALQAQSSGNGCCRNTVLTCASLGDDPLLTHMLGQQSLPDGVIYLVGTGVIQVFPLEKYTRAADLVRPSPGFIQG